MLQSLENSEEADSLAGELDVGSEEGYRGGEGRRGDEREGEPRPRGRVWEVRALVPLCHGVAKNC